MSSTEAKELQLRLKKHINDKKKKTHHEWTQFFLLILVNNQNEPESNREVFFERMVTKS